MEEQERYRVGEDTTVGEVLFVLANAEEIFERHGCEAEFECTEEHHLEYTLLDTSATCHVDDTDALIADINAAIEAEESARAA